MKTLYDFVKELGWMAAVAIVLVLSGYALGTGVSLKKVLDGDVAGNLSTSLSLILLVLGFVFLVSTLVHAEGRLREARTKTSAAEATAETLRTELRTAQTESVRASGSNNEDALRNNRDQVSTLRSILQQHRAMSGPDDEDHVTRVFRSAQRMRTKMDEIVRNLEFGPTARELAQKVSVYCSEFLNAGEYLERRSRHTILAASVSEEISSGQLDEQDRQSYIDALGRWRTQVSTLIEGAEIAVGIGSH